MAPARIRADKRKETAETRRTKVYGKRPSLQRGRPVWFGFSQFVRFSGLTAPLTLRRPRTSNKEQVHVVNEVETVDHPIEERKQTDLETDIIFFWRDQDAKFCTICGEEEEKHVELACPYNYLSPDAYAPCKARLLLWGSGISDFPCRSDHRGEAHRRRPDDVTLRRVGFLRCFVRVNNLPERCDPEELVSLFNRFGPLRTWHVRLHSSGACRGFGYVIFRHRGHANEAIEALNCYRFRDWDVNRHPVGHKHGREYMMSQAKAPEMTLGFCSYRIIACCSVAGLTSCYVCGEDGHAERTCPYNYIYVRYVGPMCCRGECAPGQHSITTSAVRREFLRCVVRVNNTPPGFTAYNLACLCEPFGRLLMWDVPWFENDELRSYGVVVFRYQEDGERAVEGLNGYDVGSGRRLRVDWAYPSV